MSELKPIIITLVLGVLVLVAVRLSRRSYEKLHGVRSDQKKFQAFIVYVEWCLLIGVVFWIEPFAVLAICGVYYIGVVPIASGSPGMWRDIKDMGFLALVTATPIYALLQYG